MFNIRHLHTPCRLSPRLLIPDRPEDCLKVIPSGSGELSATIGALLILRHSL